MKMSALTSSLRPSGRADSASQAERGERGDGSALFQPDWPACYQRKAD
jgi:hypothetical protein